MIIGVTVSLILHVIALFMIFGLSQPDDRFKVEGENDGQGVLISLVSGAGSRSPSPQGAQDREILKVMAQRVALQSPGESSTPASGTGKRPNVLKELDSLVEPDGPSKIKGAETPSGNPGAAHSSAGGKPSGDLDPWAKAALSSDPNGQERILTQVLRCWQKSASSGLVASFDIDRDGRLVGDPKIDSVIGIRVAASQENLKAKLSDAIRRCAPYVVSTKSKTKYVFTF